MVEFIISPTQKLTVELVNIMNFSYVEIKLKNTVGPKTLSLTFSTYRRLVDFYHQNWEKLLPEKNSKEVFDKYKTLYVSPYSELDVHFYSRGNKDGGIIIPCLGLTQIPNLPSSGRVSNDSSKVIKNLPLKNFIIFGSEGIRSFFSLFPLIEKEVKYNTKYLEVEKCLYRRIAEYFVHDNTFIVSPSRDDIRYLFDHSYFRDEEGTLNYTVFKNMKKEDFKHFQYYFNEEKKKQRKDGTEDGGGGGEGREERRGGFGLLGAKKV